MEVSPTSSEQPSGRTFEGIIRGIRSPGVLICECCFQAGAMDRPSTGRVRCRDRRAGSDIQDARFRRIATGRDAVLRTLDDVSDAYYLTGRASVGDELAVRVSFACISAKAEER